ncbi:MAG: hypothetical protein IPO41_02080 [Acidobacteria bacterium]|nr:hypothetical protein [Acidobacteriota bacterium]
MLRSKRSAHRSKKEGGIDNIRNNLKTRKSIEAVIANAKVTEGEWIDETVGQPTAAEAVTDEGEKKPKKAAKKKEPAKNSVK